MPGCRQCNRILEELYPCVCGHQCNHIWILRAACCHLSDSKKTVRYCRDCWYEDPDGKLTRAQFANHLWEPCLSHYRGPPPGASPVGPGPPPGASPKAPVQVPPAQVTPAPMAPLPGLDAPAPALANVKLGWSWRVNEPEEEDNSFLRGCCPGSATRRVASEPVRKGRISAAKYTLNPVE